MDISLAEDSGVSLETVKGIAGDTNGKISEFLEELLVESFEELVDFVKKFLEEFLEGFWRNL